MALLVPAILEQTVPAFKNKAEDLEHLPEAQRIQVDFCDGQFVQTETVQVKDVELLNPAFQWEAHIMAVAPSDFFDYQLVGFSTIIVHIEAYPTAAELRTALLQIQSLGLQAGVGVNPETPLAAVVPLADIAQQFTLMTIPPGRQGQAMLPSALSRIAELRALLPNAVIEVDGGVKKENCAAVAAAGADLLVVGSALGTEPVRNFQDLQSSLQK